MWDTGWAQSPLMFNVINSKPPLVKCHNTFRWKHLEHRRTTKRGSKWRKIVFHETEGENEEKRFKWKHPPFLSEHSETSSNTYTRHKSPPKKIYSHLGLNRVITEMRNRQEAEIKDGSMRTFELVRLTVCCDTTEPVSSQLQKHHWDVPNV